MKQSSSLLGLVLLNLQTDETGNNKYWFTGRLRVVTTSDTSATAAASTDRRTEKLALHLLIKVNGYNVKLLILVLLPRPILLD